MWFNFIKTSIILSLAFGISLIILIALEFIVSSIINKAKNIMQFLTLIYCLIRFSISDIKYCSSSILTTAMLYEALNLILSCEGEKYNEK